MGGRTMSLKHVLFSVICIVLLAACGNDSSESSEPATSVTNNSSEQKSETKPSTTEQNNPTSEEKQQDKINDDEQMQEEPANTKSQQQADNEKATDEPVVTQEEKTEKIANAKEEEQITSTQNEEEAEEPETAHHTGFSVVNGEVESADNIPVADEAAIRAAFDEYIDAFNAKDIKRYKNVLAQNPEGFDLTEDVESAKNIFNSFDIHREATNITITEYTGSLAYVYADMKIDVKQDHSESHDEGKQLTQFVKESTGWKVTSLQAIGSAAKN